MFKSLVEFISNMDARAARAAGVAAALLVVLVIGLLVGQSALDAGSRENVRAWLDGMRASGWGPAAVVAMFVIGAFFGAPQTLLFGVTVFVFGFSRGLAYLWCATLISATITFLCGRYLGADALARFGGGATRRVTAFVGSNGFTASLIIRLVPSAPFIVVNMALGAAGVRLASFVGGTAIGIIPKALIVAAIAGGVLEVSEGGDWRIALGLAGVAVVWIGVIIIARKRLRSANQSEA